MMRNIRIYLSLFLLGVFLSACGGIGSKSSSQKREYFTLKNESFRQEIVLYSIGLLNTRYQFGGSNPEAGLDCSGMVAYVVEQVSGQRLPHNASQIAYATRSVEYKNLQVGDLVFFNTSGKAYSHMGIYIGDNKFIHAPSSKGQVRIEALSSAYFASRLMGARTFFE